MMKKSIAMSFLFAFLLLFTFVGIGYSAETAICYN
jgi:hypothetical protein